MSDLECFNKIREENKKKYEQSMDKSVKEKLTVLESIIKKDNTEEEYLFEFLKLKKEIGDIDLKKFLTYYEVGISKTKFNKNFGEIYTKKSAYEKLLNFFEILKNIDCKINQDDKFFEIIQIFDFKNEKYNQTFPIAYSKNKELYFNSLIYMLIKQIKKDILNENINAMDISVNNLIKIYKVKKLQLENQNMKDKESIIAELKEITAKIIEFFDEDIFNYINDLSYFISRLYIKFKIKFEKYNIFIDEKYSENQKDGINLFTDFIYFLKNFIFTRKDVMFHIKVWSETFEPIILKDQNYESEEDNLVISRINNDLKVSQRKTTFFIQNIDNYTNPLIQKVKESINNLDIFKLTKYLKKDKYDSSIFIKSHWNEVSDYISHILSSSTMKSAYKKLFNSDSLFPRKEDINKIMNNIYFFSYQTDAVAETKKRFLLIYMQARIKNIPDNIHIKKVVYLAVFLIACIHEIIGHMYVRIYNYLNPEKKISSPMPKNLKSNYAKEREKEYGEFLEEQLFGNYEFKMTMKQILFILDKSKYNEVNIDNFRKNFESINDKTEIKISEDFKKILVLHGIELKKLETLEKNKKFLVNKSKYNNKIQFPQHHSIFQIDSDDN